MRVSIVVPTYNRRERVRRTLASLFEQDYPSSDYEVIVVVDGSTDGTASSLRSLRPACSFQVLEQENRGLAGARNTGWRVAVNELVVFVDDDMLCDKFLISAHHEAQRDRGPIIGVGAIFLSVDSPRTIAAECFKREVGAYSLQHLQDPGIPIPFSACIFSNTSIQRSLLVESRGFDERFRMREDAELGGRLVSKGVELRYVAGAVAQHFYDKTSEDLIRDAEAFAVADTLLARECPERASGTFLARLASEPHWKRALRLFAAKMPWLTDALLAPWCLVGDIFFKIPFVRNMGARALQIRRGIHYFRSAMSSL